MNITWVGAHSDNYYPGRAGHVPLAIVIHRAGGSIAGVDSWFNTSLAARQAALPDADRSSAHYCVAKDGDIHQYVAVDGTAFANGIVNRVPPLVAAQGGNPNDYTLSIELEGLNGESLTAAQYASLTALMGKLFDEEIHAPPSRFNVLKHDDITFTACPGIQESGMMAIIRGIQYTESVEGDDMTRQETKDVVDAHFEQTVVPRLQAVKDELLAAIAAVKAPAPNVTPVYTQPSTGQFLIYGPNGATPIINVFGGG